MRRLNPEEEALWRKVVSSVQPLPGRRVAPAPRAEPQPIEVKSAAPVRAPAARPSAPPKPKVTGPGETLDGSWDRRLSRGLVQPDRTLDLHGHNLSTAYHLLDDQLESAIGSGARVLLLITGKPPGAERPVKRGAIRAAIGDWLAASRHAGDIAAVRGAHQRHGGSGALYIILRRRNR
jgi:DNA-nicking Smr family endonuclease